MARQGEKREKRSIKVIIEGFRADVFKWLKRKGIALSLTWYIRQCRKASNSTRNVTMSLNGKFSHLTFHFLIQSFTHSHATPIHVSIRQHVYAPCVYIQRTGIDKNIKTHTAEKCFQISDKFIKFMAIVEWKKAQLKLKNWLPISEV